MTHNDEKSRSSQLSFEFSREARSGVVGGIKTGGVVTHFVSRESASVRKEAIERVKRDGIFSVPVKAKA